MLIPAGDMVCLPVRDVRWNKNGVVAEVVKESPEAEDVTHGAIIKAKASLCPVGVVLEGGKGVGVITKKGLKLRVGEKAINPVPRYYILKNVGEVLRELGVDTGVRVVISVEDGERIATSTVNSKLGIVGGISILGTRGTVVPYSAKSFMDSILVELSVAKAQGVGVVVFAPGRESLDYAREKLSFLSDEIFIAVGDYVYFAFKHAGKMGFLKSFFFAQPAKLAKVAYGFKNTHAKYGLLPLKWLAEVLGIGEVAYCNTVREAWGIEGVKEAWRVVEQLAQRNLEEWFGRKVEIFTIPYSEYRSD